MEIKKVNEDKIQYCFEVLPVELEKNLTVAYEKLQPKVELKGFRKGHVPRKIFEARFGKNELYANALKAIVEQKYEETINKKDFESIGIPQVVNLEEKKFKDKQAFTFALEFIVKPTVTLGSYLGLKVKKADLEIKEEEITAKIDALLDSKATLEPKTTDLLELGDTAIFDFEGTIDGKPFAGGNAKNFSLEIGSGQFIPGFEEQMKGMKKGETKDLEVIFPSEYHQKDLANQKTNFKVTLHEIKSKQKPELTLDFIASLQMSAVHTLQDLQNKIKEELLEQKTKIHDQNVSKQVTEQIIATTKLQIPQDIINQEKKRLQNEFELQLKNQNLTLEQYQQYLGITKEKMEAEWLEQAKKELEYQLIMEKIAEEQKITISPEQIEEAYQNLSQIHNRPVAHIKHHLNQQSLTNSLLMDEAFKLVVKSVIFVD